MTETIDPKYDINREGRQLVKDYQCAVERTAQLKAEYDSSVVDQANACRALIKWCAPADAKPGEKFGIWCRDQYGNEVLIEAQTEYSDPVIAGIDDGNAARQRHEGTINLRYRK